MLLTLRPVRPKDREFLLGVYAASRETELAMVPWDDATKRAFIEHQFDAQSLHYDKEYKNVTHEVILIDSEPAGRLFVSRGAAQTAILDVTVLPEFRRRGIATELIRRLQSEARPLRVFVEPWNPSHELFRKLGFKIVSQDESNLRMEWDGHQC